LPLAVRVYFLETIAAHHIPTAIDLLRVVRETKTIAATHRERKRNALGEEASVRNAMSGA